MVEKFKLLLEDRKGVKPNALRRQGKVPATVYGPGAASECVCVDEREFSRLPAAAYSHIVECQTPKGVVPVLIRNVQRDHTRTSKNVLNVEFYRVANDRKLTVTVPLKFSGVSPAVTGGGHFQENYSEANVECFPGDIPDSLEVDVSQITEVDHGIHFGDLKLPKGVELLNPKEEVVCRVVAAKAEKGTPGAAAAPAAASAAAAAPAAAK